jgi:cytochrome c peroxidase
MLPGLDSATAMAAPAPDSREIARIAAAIDLKPVALSEIELADLLAFLDALTDPRAAAGRLGAPAVVPSGLRLDRLTLN